MNTHTHTHRGYTHTHKHTYLDVGELRNPAMVILGLHLEYNKSDEKTVTVTSLSMPEVCHV